jgi:hypothetical protein
MDCVGLQEAGVIRPINAETPGAAARLPCLGSADRCHAGIQRAVNGRRGEEVMVRLGK